MDTPILILLISLLLLSSLPPLFSVSSPHDTLTASSSLFVSDVLISKNGIFSAGFYSVGENAYCFSIWFTERTFDGDLTVVWMANRDRPVNGERSKLSLLKSGNLILTDAPQFTVWSTNTKSISPLYLQLLNTGNLVLRNRSGSMKVWESFDSPTDTLLPNQPITRNSKLVSSRSHKNFSSGFYSLFFDYDNVLHLLFDGEGASSMYWPDPWLISWAAGRNTWNNSATAAFNSSGYFRSSDAFKFKASDYGIGVWRRLRMDVDGNVRLYSLDEGKRIWNVSWQAISQPCRIHGVCGPNAMCNYDHPGENAGRRCSCLPGYKAKNLTDWSLGCEPEFNLSCNAAESGFIKLPHVEFYGYDIKFYGNYTYERCEKVCLQSCKCYGFNFKFNRDSGYYNCYPKSLLLNGYRSPAFGDPLYLRLPKASVTFFAHRKQEIGLHCPSTTQNLLLDRGYKKPKQNRMLQFMVWFASAFGGFEIIFICIVWLLLYKTQQRSSENTQSYLQNVSGFRKFTYAELKKATRNFREEIRRGGSGIVYKGVLSDRRVAAIKRLNEANQGEAEFLAEVSIIGRVNHMNLIEIWGYCVEGNHRLLVYEYMECGSLGENLISGTLDWEKRFDIVVGSARGLAYLHEECLEWVLHCDVNPQNILLDSNFQSKVADFGLFKLVNRGGGGKNSSFTSVRGTRGCMAPEWISNLPITSKVDVYSYGVVVLEMVTGKSPMTTGGQGSGNTGEMEQRGLVKWVREKMNGNGDNELWLEEIIDPVMKGKCDLRKMGILVQVALECVKDDEDARPTMSQVIERLLPH
ncbi:putative receptor protein kinase ZmPK1 [Rhododendron vialii]|uniref:putative receptor protein kinase ZmPK1 n=1 Tax=Rhododendron vialii TaxID=182163 RepID=UPI00265F0CF4|nr:putative receptor protein kinase ZmPK1 [Rhododendron vialii]